jgi:hypothetical protein
MERDREERESKREEVANLIFCKNIYQSVQNEWMQRSDIHRKQAWNS